MSMSTLNTKGQSLGERSTGTLKEWKTMYEAENINYDSASLYAEVGMFVDMFVRAQYSLWWVGLI